MRQLIDTEFIDNTSYPQQVSGDVGCVIIDHFTGPVNQLLTLSFDNFISLFPPTRGIALTPSYVNAYRAYQAGLQTVEVVCLQGQKKYFVVSATPAGVLSGKRQEKFTITEPATEAFVIGLKYPGNIPELYDTKYTYYIKIEVSDENTEIEGVLDVKVSLVKRAETPQTRSVNRIVNGVYTV